MDREARLAQAFRNVGEVLKCALVIDYGVKMQIARGAPRAQIALLEQIRDAAYQDAYQMWVMAKVAQRLMRY